MVDVAGLEAWSGFLVGVGCASLVGVAWPRHWCMELGLSPLVGWAMSRGKPRGGCVLFSQPVC